MVDAERVRRILTRLNEDLAVLAGYADQDLGALIEDRKSLNEIKYLFVTAIEGCIEAAQHACASEGWGPPDTNADAMRILAEHGVLEWDVAQRMTGAVGFRNVLVHGYIDADAKIVVSMLGRLGDLRAFALAMTSLIDR